jgi:hypothetical protein
MCFTVFTLLSVETLISFAKKEIDIPSTWILVFLAIAFLVPAGILIVRYSIEKKSKEEIF